MSMIEADRWPEFASKSDLERVATEECIDLRLERFATKADVRRVGKYLIAWMLLSQVTLVVWVVSLMLIAR